MGIANSFISRPTEELKIVDNTNITESDIKESIIKNENNYENINNMAEIDNTIENTDINIDKLHQGEDDIKPIKETIENDIQEVEKEVKSIFSHKREKYAFMFFMLPIILMSIVSMSHLVDFFKLGSSTVIAWILGFAFEAASLSTIIGIVLLRKIKKWALWMIWILLFTLQIVGNVYSPFSFIDPIQAIKLFQFFGLNPSVISSLRIISVIQGGLLPTATFFLFKVTMDYLKLEEK